MEQVIENKGGRESRLPPEPKKVEVEPGNISLQHAGQHYRSWVVRMPKAAIPEDIRAPEIWRRVQYSPITALRKHDRVYVIGYADDWALEGIVTFANKTEAVIATQRLIQMEDRGAPLPSTEDYEVRWEGSGFGVFRKRDNQNMFGHAFANVQLADGAMRNLYAKAL